VAFLIVLLAFPRGGIYELQAAEDTVAGKRSSRIEGQEASGELTRD
jgi:hypothetical protein